MWAFFCGGRGVGLIGLLGGDEGMMDEGRDGDGVGWYWGYGFEDQDTVLARRI